MLICDLILLFYILHNAIANNYFCKFSCGKSHTVCKRQPCPVSKACGDLGKMLPLSNTERLSVLDAHNVLRNNLALGKDKKGGNDEASNMQALNYDKELEFVAQCWSNACREGNAATAHDSCRTTRKFQSVGQNMYSASNINPKSTDLLHNAVNLWYSEIKDCSKAQTISYLGKAGIGHFAQVIWAKTTRVGCGRTAYRSENGLPSVYIYCNYGPGGNVLGQPIYKRGKPCLGCKKCNSKYKGLCGDVTDVDKDEWKPPFQIEAFGSAIGSTGSTDANKSGYSIGDNGSSDGTTTTDDGDSGDGQVSSVSSNAGDSSRDKENSGTADKPKLKKRADSTERCVINRKIIVINSDGMRKKADMKLLAILLYCLLFICMITE